MASLESQLELTYQGARDRYTRLFLQNLRALNLATYTAAPFEALLPLVVKSMDAFVEALVSRNPDAYVVGQRANFAARLRTGGKVEDLIEGLAAAQTTMEVVLGDAYAGSPDLREQMAGRVRSYLMLSRTMMTELMAARPTSRH